MTSPQTNSSSLAPLRYQVDIGPELMLLSDGLQPFMFRTGSGAIVLQAQMSFPPGSYQQDKDPYPGLPGTVISRDNGSTWRRWYPPANLVLSPRWWMTNPVGDVGPIIEGNGVQLKDGPLIALSYAADGPNPLGQWWGRRWESADDWETVTAHDMVIDLPQARQMINDNGQIMGIRFHRTLLELPDGDLLATAYGAFEGDVEYMEEMPRCSKCRSFLLRSQDRGKRWEYVATMAYGTYTEEGFDEPVLARVSGGPREGRLVCIMRTGCQTPLYEVISDDGGHTWSTPVALPFPGVDPDLIEMADGTLVCCFGWRVALNPDGSVPPEHAYYLTFSHDQGDTWSELVRLDIDPHSRVGYSTSYSAVLEIEPGVLLVAYDVGSWQSPVRYVASRTVKLR